MPIYEYICKDCQTRHERLVLTQDEKIACPKCASTRQTLQFSVFRTTNNSSKSDSASAGGSCGCTPNSCGCH